jgi:hypothetical protein
MIRKYDEYGNPLDSDSELVNSYLKDKYFTGDLSDANLDAQRQTTEDRRLAAGLGQGASTIASALSGAKPQTEFYDKMAANADRGVKDIEGRRKSKMDEARFAQEAQKFGREETKFAKEQRLEDPMSPESRVFQNAIKAASPEMFTDDELQHVSAADKDRITSLAQLKEQVAARKEAAQLSYQTRSDARTEKKQERAEKLETPLGQAKTEQDAKDIKDATASYHNLKQGLQKMEDLRNKYGSEFLNRSAVAEGKNLSTDLLLEYKQLAKLGVLSKSDTDLLNKLIPEDPLQFEWTGSTMKKLKTLSDTIDGKLKNFADSKAVDSRKATDRYSAGAGGGSAPNPLEEEMRKRGLLK